MWASGLNLRTSTHPGSRMPLSCRSQASRLPGAASWAGVDDASQEEDAGVARVADQEHERMIRPELPSAALHVFITTPVAAAASVPSSFTSTKAL